MDAAKKASPWFSLLAALFLGALWSLAYPRWDLHGLAWCVPGLLWWLGGNNQTGRGLLLTWIASLAHALCTLHWLRYMPHAAGALAGWLALSLYCSLFPLLWAWLFGWFWRPTAKTDSVSMLETVRSWSLLRAQVVALMGANLWALSEWMVSSLITGFPWLILGSTQRPWSLLAQTASMGGVTMISWVMVWLSLATCMGLCRLRSRSPKPWVWIPDVLLPIVVLGMCHLYGYWRIRNTIETRPEQRFLVAAIQPAFPQTLIWESGEGAEKMTVLENLTEAALQTNPDLILWPESAYPGNQSLEPTFELLKKHGSWLCFNTTDVDVLPEVPAGPAYYNAAFLVSPDGQLAGRYRKRHLVMFGEYVPWADTWPWLKNLSPIQSSYRAGQTPITMEMQEPKVFLYPLICFEDVMPALSLDAIKSPSPLLVNLTNDGWFQQSAAQYQHANLAAFRCIETGLAMVRSGNNGLSCWIDPLGQIQGIAPSSETSPYERGFQTFQIPIGWKAPTYYPSWGRLFHWMCLGMTACLGMHHRWKQSKQTAPV